MTIYFSKLGQMGRLGNSLFQLAATISLAIDNNDLYIFPSWEFEQYFPALQGCFSNNIKPKSTYQEPHFHYAPIPYSEGMDITGFYQSYKYFENNQAIIQGLLTPKNNLGIKYGYTSIHCRRGDYLTSTDCYENLGMDYYNKAMDMIKSKHYIVFSDDIEWCKKNFIGEQFIFSEGRSPIEDFILQKSCANNIIANSSFSLFSAWLNLNPSKIVIAPKKWFGPKLNHDTKDLIPKDWIQV